MDLQQAVAHLSGILISTYNADQTVRQAAEAALQGFLNTVGSASVLLSLIGQVDGAGGVSRDLRLAAALVMKNSIKEFWRTEANLAEIMAKGTVVKTRLLTPVERQSAKASLIGILLAETDNAMRKNVAETIKQICEWEPPETGWPELVPTLSANTVVGGSSSPLRIYNALVGLRQVLKRYQFSREKRREAFDGMIIVVFPPLQALLQSVASLETLEAASIIHVSLKLFYSAVNYQLPAGVAGSLDIVMWFNLLAAIINKPLPDASEGTEPRGQPSGDHEERRQWPWWKAKKWATCISQHLFSRYGNPKYSAPEVREFSSFFCSHASLLLLGPVLNVLQTKAQGGFITTDVHRNCLSFLGSAIELSATYKLIKPHLAFVLSGVLLPTLCISAADVRLFSEDPIEFVRKAHDPMGEFLDPVSQARHVLQSLARHKPKHCLPLLQAQLVATAGQYRQLVNAGQAQEEHHRAFDGVLVCVGAVCKFALTNKKPEVSLVGLRNFILQFVATELHVVLSSPQTPAYLRARACETIEYLEDYSWGEGPGGQAVLQSVLQGLLMSLRDSALPVQAAAACSFRTMIDAEGAADLLRPMLPDLVSEYFRITSDLESDVVLEALQKIVEQFGDEMASLAPTMVQHLLGQFTQFKAGAGDDDDDAQMSASQSLTTISAVLDGQSDKPEVLASLEPLLCPLVLHVLSSGQWFEHVEECLDFMYYLAGPPTQPLSAQMWGLCGPLLHSLRTEAFDYLDDFRSIVALYLQRDVATFCSLSYAPPVQPAPALALGGDDDNDFQQQQQQQQFPQFQLQQQLQQQQLHLQQQQQLQPAVSLLELMLSVVAIALRCDSSGMETDARAAVSMLYILVASARDRQCLHAGIGHVLALVVPRLLGQQLYEPTRGSAGDDDEEDDDDNSGNNSGAGAGGHTKSASGQKLLGCRSESLKHRLLEVVLACFYYNPAVATAALSSLESRPFEAVFRTLFDELPRMDSPISSRIIVLALTSILAADDQTKAAMPAELQSNLGVLLQHCVRELGLLREQKYDEPCLEEYGHDDDEGEGGDDDDDDFDYDDDDLDEDDDDDDDDDGQGGGGGVAMAAAAPRSSRAGGGGGGASDEDGDVLDGEAEGYHDYVARLKAQGGGRSTKYVGGYAVDDDGDDPSTLSSPADRLDVLLFFIDTLSAVPPAAAQALQQALGPEDMQRLQGHAAAAQARREATAAAAAAAAAAVAAVPAV